MDVTTMDLSNFLEREEQAEYHKKLAAEAESFLQSCGKKPLEVFRMEAFVPTPQPDNTFGKFHEGDSYVVCKQNQEDYQIHYWHGKDATADEMGCSAFFSVQLSERLPKKSSHHLEEQAHESEDFMSYFESGVQYLPGGIDSGFKEVVVDLAPKLYQCKGARYPRIFSVPVEANSVNEGDVFILVSPQEGDADDIIYFWPGQDCNVSEKMKGLQVADNIRRDEFHCRAEIRYPRETDELDAAFWNILGGKPGTINPATPDDVAQSGEAEHEYHFYHISDSTGKLLCTEVTERPLKKDMLDTSDTYILELARHIYIWIGKTANVQEKKSALQIGQGFLKEKKKPAGTRVTRIVEGAEDTHFRSFFDGFYAKKAAEVSTQDMEKAANEKRKVVASLLTNLGNYTVKVYLCINDQPLELPEAEQGHFFQDNVYAIDVKGENHRYIVQWFGPRMAADKVSEYRKYLDILTDYTFIPSEISRVSCMQGHEDDTLLTFFPNGFVCHDGERTEQDAKMAMLTENGAMYRVQGPFGETPQAIEQDLLQTSNLNSGESFAILEKGGAKKWAWLGSGSSDIEKQYCEKVCAMFPGDAAVTVVEEGKEEDDFWAALGGKGEYLNFKELGFDPSFESRLFDMRFSEKEGGVFWMAEVPNHSQMDLHMDGIFVLDAYKTIYMWVGGRANKFKKNNAGKKIDQYVAHLQDRNPKDVQVVQIVPTDEPLLFKSMFPEWEQEVADKWNEPDPYTARQLAMAKEREEYLKKFAPKKEETKALASGVTFDLEVLKTSLPDGVPAAEKEKFLSDEQFVVAFKMNREAFGAAKLWRQQKMKKEAGLF